MDHFKGHWNHRKKLFHIHDKDIYVNIFLPLYKTNIRFGILWDHLYAYSEVGYPHFHWVVEFLNSVLNISFYLELRQISILPLYTGATEEVM